MEIMEGESVVVRGRVEIDTRQPFRSVREAVMLFGEKVLAEEVYGNKFKEMQTKARNGGNHLPKLGAVTAELEETKKSLQKAKEEGNLMVHYLTSLRQELEQTKRELHQLKLREAITHLDQPEIEELKFVENTSQVEMITIRPENAEDHGLEYSTKRSVKFASPLLSKNIDNKDNTSGKDGLSTLSSKKMMKRKFLGPLIIGLFLKKTVNKDGES